MSHSDTCSSLPAWVRVPVAALVVSAAMAHGAAAQVVTQEEALARAFPAARVERRTAYLDEAQLVAARRDAGAGVDVTQSVVTHYVARDRHDRVLGVAYFDSHRVRTLGEVVMVVVSPDGRTRSIEVLKFAEPPEYRAPDAWLQQFAGKPLTPALTLKRDIVNMTGATLTAEAVTRAVRRVLALHRVIDPARGGS
jgi:Na+-translocating ferredoxin:NAD+ oxidoreductase RnfG subunit